MNASNNIAHWMGFEKFDDNKTLLKALGFYIAYIFISTKYNMILLYQQRKR